ncbi:MAG: DUF975 family protein [Oscillospiraceae bacterium]|jgi:uncharacterized membrane protein|nr:DUF975 family protein [Oscillospiraceae bacterium]
MNENEPLISGLKRRARETIRAALPAAAAVSVAWFVLSAVLSILSRRVSGCDTLYGALEEEFRRVSEAGAAAMDFASYTALVREHASFAGSLLALALDLCRLVAGAGFAWSCLALARGEKPAWHSVFDSFGQLFKLVRLHILISVFTCLWGLLFIFPGIIAAFRFSMAVYVMRDHPDYGALRCIRESKELMRGRKADLFILRLSFSLWLVLAFAIFYFSGFDILSLWLNLYAGVSTAGFYLAVSRGKIVNS